MEGLCQDNLKPEGQMGPSWCLHGFLGGCVVGDMFLDPKFPVQHLRIGLDWIGLDWIGLGWVRLGWIGLDWTGLAWTGLDCIGWDCTGLYGEGHEK